MSAIHSKDTNPEMLVRRYLFRQGFRYRLNYSKLPGHPDLVLRKYRTVIFVNGCFWHGHFGCKFSRLPKSNLEYWAPKILRNQERDLQELRALNELGWRCVTVWECGLRPKFREQTLVDLASILRYLLSDSRILNLELATAGLSAGDDLPGVRPYEIPESPVTRAADPEAPYGDGET